MTTDRAMSNNGAKRGVLFAAIIVIAAMTMIALGTSSKSTPESRVGSESTQLWGCNGPLGAPDPGQTDANSGAYGTCIDNPVSTNLRPSPKCNTDRDIVRITENGWCSIRSTIGQRWTVVDAIPSDLVGDQSSRPKSDPLSRFYVQSPRSGRLLPLTLGHGHLTTSFVDAESFGGFVGTDKVSVLQIFANSRTPTTASPRFGGLLTSLGAAAGLLALLLCIRTAKRTWRRRNLRRRWWRRTPSQFEVAPAADVADVAVAEEEVALVDLSHARSALDGDVDPRRAVLACWARLEQGLVDRGVARGSTETAGELAQRLIVFRELDRDSLLQLHDLATAARYSSTPIDESSRQRAREALDRIESQVLVEPVPL